MLVLAVHAELALALLAVAGFGTTSRAAHAPEQRIKKIALARTREIFKVLTTSATLASLPALATLALPTGWRLKVLPSLPVGSELVVLGAFFGVF